MIAPAGGRHSYDFQKYSPCDARIEKAAPIVIFAIGAFHLRTVSDSGHRLDGVIFHV